MNRLNELLKQKFASGNDVQVSSVRITRAEWEDAMHDPDEQSEKKPIAWLTRNDDGDPAMLFFDYQEATSYCDDEFLPEPLYNADQNTKDPQCAQPT